MADEFVKGLGVLTAACLGWLTLSGWYTTPGFEEIQIIGEAPETLDFYGELALVSREALFWFMIFGVLVFWVLIPGLNQLRSAMGGDEDGA